MLFRPRGAAADRRAKIAAIRSWVAARVALPEDATVMVTELTCAEPGCPPLETVIAVLRGGGDRQQVKLHKPLADVTEDDVAHHFTPRDHATRGDPHGCDDDHER